MPAARARVRRDAPTTDRVAALDALRVVSMVAVVALHASAAYMTVRIPGLIWLVHEPAGSEFVQQFAWWSYGATMPAFFALAGYAAAAVLEAKGTRGYALDRVRRIGLPFLAAIPAVLVPTVLIWMLGLYLAGRCNVGELLALSFADGQIQANRFGPAHLWFLVYLIPMLAPSGRPSVLVPGTATQLLAWRAGPFLLALDPADAGDTHHADPLAGALVERRRPHPGPGEQLSDQPDPLAASQPVLHRGTGLVLGPDSFARADPGAFALAVSRGLGRRAHGPGKMAASGPRGLLDGMGRLGVGRLGVALRLADALWVARRLRATWHDMGAERSSTSPTRPTGRTWLTSRSWGSFRRASFWSRFPVPSSSCSRLRSAWPGAFSPTRPAFAAPGLAAGCVAAPRESPRFRGPRTSIATRSPGEPWPEGLIRKLDRFLLHGSACSS